MKYQVRTPAGAVLPCSDEESLISHLENTPACVVARVNSNHWIFGKSFLEFGDLAFDDNRFRAPVGPDDLDRTEIILTSETFPPFTIAARLGIVAAERVAGIGAVSEFVMGLTDVVGGQSGTMQSHVEKTRNDVLSDLKRKARQVGAQAVIGVHLGYTSIEGKGSMMLMVTAYGTAVNFAGEMAQ